MCLGLNSENLSVHAHCFLVIKAKLVRLQIFSFIFIVAFILILVVVKMRAGNVPLADSFCQSDETLYMHKCQDFLHLMFVCSAMTLF